MNFDYDGFEKQLAKLTFSDLSSEYKKVVKDIENLDKQEQQLAKEIREIKESRYTKILQRERIENVLLKKTLE